MSTLNIGGNSELKGWISRLGGRVQNFIHPLLFPKIPVSDQSGKFLRELNGFGAADPTDGIERGAGDPHYKPVDIGFDRLNGWNLADLGLRTPLDKVYDDKFGQADLKGLSMRRVKGRALWYRYHLSLERMAISIATDTSTIFTGAQTTGLIAATQWDNYSSADSNPVAIADLARATVENGTGEALLPSGARQDGDGAFWVAVMTAACFRAVRIHPKVLSAVQTAANVVPRASIEQVKAALDVDMIIIAAARANSAAPGAAAETVVSLWPNSVGFYRIQPDVAPETPQTALGHFVWDDGVDAMLNTEHRSDKVDDLWVGREQQFMAPQPVGGFIVTNVLAAP